MPRPLPPSSYLPSVGGNGPGPKVKSFIGTSQPTSSSDQSYDQNIPVSCTSSFLFAKNIHQRNPVASELPREMHNSSPGLMSTTNSPDPTLFPFLARRLGGIGPQPSAPSDRDSYSPLDINLEKLEGLESLQGVGIEDVDAAQAMLTLKHGHRAMAPLQGQWPSHFCRCALVCPWKRLAFDDWDFLLMTARDLNSWLMSGNYLDFCIDVGTRIKLFIRFIINIKYWLLTHNQVVTHPSQISWWKEGS